MKRVTEASKTREPDGDHAPGPRGIVQHDEGLPHADKPRAGEPDSAPQPVPAQEPQKMAGQCETADEDATTDQVRCRTLLVDMCLEVNLGH